MKNIPMNLSSKEFLQEKLSGLVRVNGVLSQGLNHAQHFQLEEAVNAVLEEF